MLNFHQYNTGNLQEERTVTRHYQNAAFFRFLRKQVFKIHKPVALEWGGWGVWKQETQKKHPIGYFVTEILPDWIEKPAEWCVDPIYNLKYYINNRWVTGTHALTAHPRDIRPGTWCDVGNRFLPCLFNELVDFVEIELAWQLIAWDTEARKRYSAPWYAVGWFRWRVWRSAAAGLEHLNWASSLVMDENMGVDPESEHHGKPTNQALAAREILELYTWWTQIHPARPDPHDASGWSKLYEGRRETHQGFAWADQTEAEQAETRSTLDRANQLEAEYDAEDEHMLIRLIKIRNSLWT
jgi:hypothetical protein